MKTMLRAGRLFVAVLVGVALAGCDSGSTFAPPEPPSGTGASFTEFEADVLSQAEASGIDVDALPAEMPLSMSPGRGERVFVQGDVGDVAVEAVIGASGGVLNLGPHWLLVPARAVRGDVLFRMTPVDDGTFHVDLTATRLNTREPTVENDVGQAGFSRAVLLAFHYGDAPIDPAALSVAWLTDFGTLVSQPTYIFRDNAGDEWAVGALRHFSGYILVAN